MILCCCLLFPFSFTCFCTPDLAFQGAAVGQLRHPRSAASPSARVPDSNTLSAEAFGKRTAIAYHLGLRKRAGFWRYAIAVHFKNDSALRALEYSIESAQAARFKIWSKLPQNLE